MTVELGAPDKATLRIERPVMVAAGCYGLGTAYRGLVDEAQLGAVVVGPLTLRPRRGASPPRAVPLTGGVLLHTGLENPGLSTAIRRYARTWTRCPVPVVVHLAATDPVEVSHACERLDRVEAVSAVELGLSHGVGGDEAEELVAAAVRAYDRRPLLVRVPLEGAVATAGGAAAAGADALVVAAPPRGAVLYRGRPVVGRLYGPFVLPLVLRALREVAQVVDLPIIGCGGVYGVEDARAMIAFGAVAVQVGAALWKDPALPERIAVELTAEGSRGRRGSVV